MKYQIVARDKELRVLEQMYHSDEPEFLAIYGRRRVGKTETIRAFCKVQAGVFFDVAGTQKAPMSEQLENFITRISEVFYKGAPLQQVKNWRGAFRVLTQAINTSDPDTKIMLFMDEFPWMATKNSRLLQCLDYYWNQYWSKDTRIKLIICGSSASWIINKIIHNKGGLHNRITREIHLEPFTLVETEAYLNHRNIVLNKKQMTELYMVMGGIPYYLRQIERGLSASQIIDDLAFKKKSFLLEEFYKLFDSLFDDGEVYINIVRLIAKSRYGVAQTDIIKKIDKLSQGGTARARLKALEDTGFIMCFKPYTFSKKGNYYRVIDEYTLFYLKWIEPVRESLQRNALRQGYWEEMRKTSAWSAWSGLAFESICYKHLTQISQALHLPATALADSWRYVATSKKQSEGAQIDLLFDRQDDVITICEIKYNSQPFAIDKQYANELQRKVSVFSKITKTDKTIMLAMITAGGLKKTVYSDALIRRVVTIDDLFD